MFKKIVIASLIALPLLGMAQGSIPGLTTPTTGVSTLSDVNRIIVNIVNWVMAIFFVVAVLYIFWAAYLFLTASGDTEQIGQAKTQLIYSIIAIVVALLAGSIRFIVASILQ